MQTILGATLFVWFDILQEFSISFLKHTSVHIHTCAHPLSYLHTCATSDVVPTTCLNWQCVLTTCVWTDLIIHPYLKRWVEGRVFLFNAFPIKELRIKLCPPTTFPWLMPVLLLEQKLLLDTDQGFSFTFGGFLASFPPDCSEVVCFVFVSKDASDAQQLWIDSRLFNWQTLICHASFGQAYSTQRSGRLKSQAYSTEHEFFQVWVAREMQGKINS